MWIAVPSAVLTLTVLGVTYSDALPPKLGRADLVAPGHRGASLERLPDESAVYDSDGLPARSLSVRSTWSVTGPRPAASLPDPTGCLTGKPPADAAETEDGLAAVEDHLGHIEHGRSGQGPTESMVAAFRKEVRLGRIDATVCDRRSATGTICVRHADNWVVDPIGRRHDGTGSPTK